MAWWRTEYAETSFRCGACGADLSFESRRFPTPHAQYVHADNGKFRCAPPRRTNAHSARLILPWETFPLPDNSGDADA